MICVLTSFAIYRYTASPLYAGTTLSEIGFRSRRESGD